MEKFGSFCDWKQDQNLSKLRDKECCYPYHLISNCIYLQNTRTTNNCQINHSIQSESMIYLSSVDKLIIKNKNIMKKKHQKIININNGQKFSKKEKETKCIKILKNDKFSKNKKVLPIKDKPINIECHTKKNNLSENFTEKRRSRRLNNQSPIDVNLEITNDLNSSCDLILPNLISKKCEVKTKEEKKNEIIENTDTEYSIHEKYSCRVSNEQIKKIAPVHDKLLNEYQNINNVSFEKNTNNNPESILYKDTSNNLLKSSMHISCLEHKFPLTLSCNSTENSINLESISNPIFDQTCDETNTFTFLENKFIQNKGYNNTVDSHLHEDSLSTDCKFEIKKPPSPFKDHTEMIKSEKILFPLETSSNILKINKQPTPNEMFSKIIETKEFPLIQETFSENTVTEKVSCLPKPYFKLTDTKKIPSPYEPYSQIENPIKEKIPCLQETFYNIDIAKKVLFPSKSSSKTEVQNALFLEEPHSKITKSTETLSVEATFSEINKTKKVPSPYKSYPKVDEIENTLEIILEKKHSEITVAEKASCPSKMYSKGSEIGDTPYQLGLFSDIVVSNRPSLQETYSKTVSNKPDTLKKYSEKTFEDRPQPIIHSKIIVKDKTFQLEPKLCIDITPKNKPSNKDFELNINNKPSFSKINSEQTVKDYQIPSKKKPKIIKMNKLNEQKNDLKITEEKKSYREKLNFTYSLGLISTEQYEKVYKKKDVNCTNSKNNFSYSKMTEDHAEIALACNPSTNTEKLKCSYQTNNNQNRISTPVIIPDKSLGSLIHPHRKCFDICSYCHVKFELLDTICHLSQIQFYEKQNICLKNVPCLIGPHSCLCPNCFKNFKKNCHTQNLKEMTSACFVLNCEQNVDHMYHNPLLWKIKHLLTLKGIIFSHWINEKQKLQICDVHFNQLLDVVECHLCGNRALHKFEVYPSEVSIFQSILNEDQVPVTVKHDSFICKPCRVYFLWKTCKNSTKFDNQLKDYINHRKTVLRRMFDYNKFKCQLNLEKNDENKMEKREKHSLSISSLPLTENNNNSNHTVTLAVNQKQMVDNSGKNDVVFQKLKTDDINKPIMPDQKLVDTSKLTFTKPPTSVFLELNRKTSVQLDLNASNNSSFPTLSTESRNVQFKQKNADVCLPVKKTVLRQMYHTFFSDTQNLINHLIFVEKTRILGGLQLVDDSVECPITCSKGHTSLLHQKSSNTVSSCFNPYNLNPKSNKYKKVSKVDNLFVDSHGKLKTVEKKIHIDVPTIMKNSLLYNEPSKMLTKTAKPKNVSSSLSTVIENNVSKTRKDHLNKVNDSSNCKQFVASSTITDINTSVNNSTVTPSITSITTASSVNNPNSVKTPVMTHTTNSIFNSTSPMSSTNTVSTTANPVPQNSVKIVSKKCILLKERNLHNRRLITKSQNNVISRSANISDIHQNVTKYVSINAII